MVEGSLRNLLFYGVKPEGIAVADARHLPAIKADCVVTDPPYGRSATTLGHSTQQIMGKFLSTVKDRLDAGRRLCTASPKTIRVGKMGKELGFKLAESYLVPVHRNLTREIAVFEVI